MEVYVLLTVNDDNDVEVLAVETTESGVNNMRAMYPDLDVEIHRKDLTSNGRCAERGGGKS